ncbi:hypothetical protein PTKIN_Ptkin11bG0083600 [Pterospermum kingtungense]
MNFQVVVLAGGTSNNLTPLVSKEVPKPLLPVANRPVLYYVLHQLEQNNLKDLIVVVEGGDAALLVGAWISGTFVDRLHVEIAAVPEDIGTAGAIRAISRHLTAKDILVMSGDLVSDVPPGAVAATHRRHDAAVTAMLCSVPVSGPLESGSSSGKDKAKKPGRYNIIGLDPAKQFLLHIATGPEIEKDTRLQKCILHAVGQKSEASLNGSPQGEENGNEKVSSQNNQVLVSRILANASTPSFHKHCSEDCDGSGPIRKTHKCCAYIATSSSYCVRLNSIQAFMDINRDVTGEADYLLSDTSSDRNNIIGPSPKIGTKTTVGPHCMLGEGSEMGDKCQVKRSVIGRHCRIGSHVKVVNSVVMNYVTIGDGCIIQGSVICSNVQLQELVVLKDCQVGAGFVVTAGSEHKGESLARKEK